MTYTAIERAGVRWRALATDILADMDIRNLWYRPEEVAFRIGADAGAVARLMERMAFQGRLNVKAGDPPMYSRGLR